MHNDFLEILENMKTVAKVLDVVPEAGYEILALTSSPSSKLSRRGTSAMM